MFDTLAQDGRQTPSAQCGRETPSTQFDVEIKQDSLSTTMGNRQQLRKQVRQVVQAISIDTFVDILRLRKAPRNTQMCGKLLCILMTVLRLQPYQSTPNLDRLDDKFNYRWESVLEYID